MRAAAAVLALLFCASFVMAAETGASPMDAAIASAHGAVAKTAAPEAETNPAIAETPTSTVLNDQKTKATYLSAMQRYYEYRANGYAYRSRVFEWQLLSSRAIFAIVLLLVVAGVYFAAVQFRASMRAPLRPAVATSETAVVPAAAAGAMETRLELSAKGVVVNSSVLGVIILALSLGFFYLYLVYVYPIQNVF
jgi:hypothetical protein